MIPDKDILQDCADKYSPVWSPSYVESSLLSVLTRLSSTSTASCLEFSSHDRWNGLISSSLPHLGGNDKPPRMTERPGASIVNSLTRQQDHPGKTIKRERLICTRAPSCYYSLLQDDRVSPEGDKVMSRGDPEVGQLLAVSYIIHIHKQHLVVAENWLRADCLFRSSGPALCLNVKQPSSAEMLI